MVFSWVILVKLQSEMEIILAAKDTTKIHAKGARLIGLNVRT